MYHQTFIEIDTKALENNVRTLTSSYPNYDYYIGVVKGNAYGHGYDIIPNLESAGINYFAVSSLEEALEVRKRSTLPTLCLQPLHAQEIKDCVENDVTITISNLDLAKKIARLDLNKNLKVHIKIDTGFHRLGFREKSELEQALTILNGNKNIKLEGIYSHFATTGVFDKYWDKQLEKFLELTKNIDLQQFKVRHFGRSLTLINHPKIDFCNGVRLGLVMYGLEQSPSRRVSGILNKLKLWRRIFQSKAQSISATTTDIYLPLHTALSLKSEAVELKKIYKGESLGYGASWTAQADGVIAIVPVGYADGFSKRNRNGFVFVNNKRYQIVGEVNMGMITILADKTVKVGDGVEFIGRHITIQEVARRTQTGTYEVMCALQNTLTRTLK
jgi:alanine racemase